MPWLDPSTRRVRIGRKILRSLRPGRRTGWWGEARLFPVFVFLSSAEIISVISLPVISGHFSRAEVSPKTWERPSKMPFQESQSDRGASQDRPG